MADGLPALHAARVSAGGVLKDDSRSATCGRLGRLSSFLVFGVSALFLAAAGLYGVISSSVTQRTREMGVRSALGARGLQLIALVMGRSIVQLAIGMGIGLGLAVLASGALQPVLYKVDPRDIGVFTAVLVTLAFVSVVASCLPARRVARIDPVTALSIDEFLFLIRCRFASARAHRG